MCKNARCISQVARLSLLAVLVITSCSPKPEDPVHTEDAPHVPVSDLLTRGTTLLDPGTAAPFTGGIFDVFHDDVKRVRFRGRLQDGERHGDFEFYDRDGAIIWTRSRYDRGSPCGLWLLRSGPGADLSSTTDTVPWRRGVQDRLPVPFADVLRDSMPTTRGVRYPPCPLDFGNPVSLPPPEDGLYESYLPDGKLSVKGAYMDGERAGRWETYRLSGELTLVETFNAGRRHGPYQEIGRGGEVRRDGSYGHGERCGEWIEWGDRISYPPCPSSSDTVR